MILQLRSRYSYSIFNGLFYEEPNLGDNMAGENNLIYSLTLLFYVQVSEYKFFKIIELYNLPSYHIGFLHIHRYSYQDNQTLFLYCFLITNRYMPHFPDL